MSDEFFQKWLKVNIKGIVFDMDGVLVDTSPCHAAAYQKMWQILDMKGPDYSEIAGRSTKDVIVEYAPMLSSEEQLNAVTLKQSTALKMLAITDVGFEDVRNALERLKVANLPMAIATSASKASADLVLENLAIRHFFQSVITSEDVAKSKPEPDLFITAIQTIEVDANEVLILEDSLSGIAAALASGAHAVTVRRAETLTAELVDHSKFLGHFESVESVVNKLDDFCACGNHVEDSV